MPQEERLVLRVRSKRHELRLQALADLTRNEAPRAPAPDEAEGRLLRERLMGDKPREHPGSDKECGRSGTSSNVGHLVAGKKGREDCGVPRVPKGLRVQLSQMISQ